MSDLEKCKIAFFHPYFAYGGVEKTNIRLSKYFIEHGYQVDFVALTFTDHLKNELDELGINCITLKAERALFAVPKLRQYIKDEQKKGNLTIISCQNYANLAAILAIPKDRKRLKVIVSERLHPAEFAYNGKGRKGKIILRLMKHLYRKADAIVANSKETADEIKKITGQDVRCIYNPTLSGNYLALSHEPVENKWFQEEIPIVVSVGRLAYEKGFDILLKAYAEVQKQCNCRLAIIGEGEKRKELEELAQELGISENVWMPGYDSNPYKYISKASVFVLSSRFEGLPNTLIEALAVGTPCVAACCKSGPKEILLEGKGGYLTPVENVAKMAEAMYAALTNKEESQRRLKAAEAMLYRFTPTETGKQYIELIEGLW
jgi:glycosyltransferase involved in cell wall biosynthesis